MFQDFTPKTPKNPNFTLATPHQTGSEVTQNITETVLESIKPSPNLLKQDCK
jgi:hypothetical protein